MIDQSIVEIRLNYLDEQNNEIKELFRTGWGKTLQDSNNVISNLVHYLTCNIGEMIKESPYCLDLVDENEDIIDDIVLDKKWASYIKNLKYNHSREQKVWRIFRNHDVIKSYNAYKPNKILVILESHCKEFINV